MYPCPFVYYYEKICELDSFNKVTFAISTLVILYCLKQIWNVFYIFVLGPVINNVDFKSYGEWAVVTGSTDGIGKAYARQLAARGCNIVLVSRSMDKLTAVAKEIEKEYNVKTKVVQADFTDNEEIYTNIAAKLADLEIGVLVNNVGISYPYPEYFLDLPDWKNLTSNLIKVNVVSVIRMTALVLPNMVKRGKGIIVNVGSGTSEIPSPLLTVYAGTKAFVKKFTIGLSQEYKNKGIIIQCVTPAYVQTNMSKFKSTSFLIPSADAYAKTALSLINTITLTSGYFSHALMHNFLNTMHSLLGNFIVNKTIKKLERARNVITREKKKQ